MIRNFSSDHYENKSLEKLLTGIERFLDKYLSDVDRPYVDSWTVDMCTGAHWLSIKTNRKIQAERYLHRQTRREIHSQKDRRIKNQKID
jgi:hypothetical protein